MLIIIQGSMSTQFTMNVMRTECRLYFQQKTNVGKRQSSQILRRFRVRRLFIRFRMRFLEHLEMVVLTQFLKVVVE